MAQSGNRSRMAAVTAHSRPSVKYGSSPPGGRRSGPQPVPLFAAAEDFPFGQPVALRLPVAPPDAAVEAVVFAVVGELNKPPDEHLPPVDFPGERPGRLSQDTAAFAVPRFNQGGEPLVRQSCSRTRVTRAWPPRSSASVGGLGADARQLADLAREGGG